MQLAKVCSDTRRHNSRIQRLISLASFILLLAGGLLKTVSSPDAQTTKELDPSNFHNLDPNRYLFFKPLGSTGLSNQQQCLQIAALVAIQQNRTLVVPRYGYRSSHHHDMRQIPFYELYNKDGITVDHRLEGPGLTMNFSGARFNPRKYRPKYLLHDTHANQRNATFACLWGYTLYSFNPGDVPYVQDIFFPYHQSIWKKGRALLKKIQYQVGSGRKMRLLAMQIRLGDRSSSPILSCGENLVLNPMNFSKKCDVGSYGKSPMKWTSFLANGFPLVAAEFDAVFIATNEPVDVRAALQIHHNNLTIPPVFFIDDLLDDEDTSVSRENTESVNRLVLEEIICVLSARLVPSIPSSITQILLALRLNQHPENMHDMLLSEAYWNLTISSMREKFGPNAKLDSEQLF